MTVPGWWRALPGGKPISALGFGCSSLWAKADFDETLAQAVLDAATAGEINHFDTAPSYGEGHGERRLGLFLRRQRADEFVISTKIGTNLIDGRVVRGFDRDTIEKSLRASQQRLGLDHIDILYLHGPKPTDLTDNLLQWLDGLKSSGRIGLAGMESGDTTMFDRLRGTPIDVAMLHYNVGDYSTAARIRGLVADGKTVISGTVLAQGKFSLQTFLPRDRRGIWYLLRMAKNDPMFWLNGPRLAQRLRAIGRTPHDAAIAFVTGNSDILSGVFGSTSPSHVAANAAAGHLPLKDFERAIVTGGTVK